MTRKTHVYVVTEDGRDRGKQFFITEMSAMQGARWALRVLQAAARNGVNLPPEIMGAGMAGVAVAGIQAFIGMSYNDADPLIAEMLACAQIVPDPKYPNVKRGTIEDDFEEISTVVNLCAEVIKLHTSFSPAGAPSNSTSETRQPASTNTPMSPQPSEPAYHPARRSKR